ncbi:MAG: hypothetical protein ACR2L3_05005 [Actinomycetota bacterium]
MSCFVAIWLVVVGTVVLAPVAQAETTDRGPIRITKDSEFDAEHGVRSGTGTKSDPYVISGWKVGSLALSDTNSYVVVRDNEISRLILDWNGDRLLVTNNDIGDMRLNQNVPRTGQPTSGRISNNRFGTVSQIRHFDGRFANNVVGHEGSMEMPFFDDVVVRLDGFNGARFRNNTLYGALRFQLHGHHHSSSYEDTSHHHGAPSDQESDAGGMGEDVDHSQRYHQVTISDNKIYSYREAIRYTDQAHSANDRTANSEQNEELNGPHVHYTKVKISRNELIGGGISVDTFNAKDERHSAIGDGSIEIADNTISLARETSEVFHNVNGISVRDARGMHLMVTGNVISATTDDAEPLSKMFSGDAGISLVQLDAATVHLYGNSVSGTDYGVFALNFTESVQWWVQDLQTQGVETEVYYDQSVKNEPQGSP